MYHIFTIFQMRRTEAITIPLAWPSGDKHIDNGQPLHLDPDPIFSPLLKNSSHLRYFVWIDSTHVQKANRIKICILLYFTGPFPPLPFTGNKFLDFFWGVFTESLSKYKKYIPPPCFYLLHQQVMIVTCCTLLHDAPCSAPLTSSYTWRYLHMDTSRELPHSLFSCLVFHDMAVTEFI